MNFEANHRTQESLLNVEKNPMKRERLDQDSHAYRGIKWRINVKVNGQTTNFVNLVIQIYLKQELQLEDNTW